MIGSVNHISLEKPFRAEVRLPRLPKQAWALLYLAATLLAGFFLLIQVRTISADAIEFDNSFIDVSGTTCTACTISNVSVSAGEDRILVAAAAFKPQNLSPTSVVSSVTYNGVAFTKAAGITDDLKVSTSVWYLTEKVAEAAAPGTFDGTARTLTINVNNGGSRGRSAFSAISLRNIMQTNPIDGSNTSVVEPTSDGEIISIDVTTTVPDSYIIDAAGFDKGFAFISHASHNHTRNLRASEPAGKAVVSTHGRFGSDPSIPAGAITMDWTVLTFRADRLAVHTAVAFKPNIVVRATSTATLADTFDLGFPRTSSATVSDTFDLGFPRTSSATVSDTSGFTATFGRTSTAALGDTSQSDTVFGRTSTATLLDPFDLGFPRTSTATVSDTLGFTATFGRTSAATLADPSQSDTVFGRASTASLGEQIDFGFPMTSAATLADTSQIGIGVPRTSTATLADASGFTATFNRTSTATAGDTTDLGLPRTSTATLGDTSQLGIGVPRSSSANLGDVSQSALAFGRTSTASLGEQIDFGLPRNSAATLGDTSQLGFGLPRSSAATLGDVFQSALALGRTSTATVGDTIGLGLPQTSTATLGDAFGLGLPRTSALTLGDSAQSALALPRSSTATLGDTFLLNQGLQRPVTSTATLGDESQSAFGLRRSSAATLADNSQSALAFPRSSAATIGDLFQGALGLPRSSAATLGDTSLVDRGVTRTSAATLADNSQSAVAFFRSSAATLGDTSSLTAVLSRSSTAILDSISQSVLSFFRSSTGSLSDTRLLNRGLIRTDTFALADTSQFAAGLPRNSAAGVADLYGLGFGNASAAALAESVVLTVQRNFRGAASGAISSVLSNNLTSDIISDGGGAGSALASFALLDPAAAGKSLADAAEINPVAAAEALLVAARINIEIGGLIFTEAANVNPETVGNALIEAAKLDTETAIQVLIAAAVADPFATSRAVVEAARTNPDLTVALLVETGRVDPIASGKVLASAGSIDSGLTGRLLIGATLLDAKVTGSILAAAAETNLVAIRNALLMAARLDVQAAGVALVVASEVDSPSISKVILSAAKVDPGVIQAALESGSAGDINGLAFLGVGVPAETFVSENPPIEGTDPSTGEVWQMVGPPSASVEVLAKFQRANPEAQVEVIDVSGLPDNVAPLPAGEIAGNFFRITSENFDQEDLRATHISFSVPKSWLEDNNIHPWAVSFNRYDEEGESWQGFNAKRVREDENFVYYTVTPPGFSLWAVSGRTAVEQVRFRVDNLTIDPPEIRERQEVIVQAQVVNLGGTILNHSATLWLNGRVQATKTVEVPPNSEMPVAFRVFPRAGAYVVRIDRQVGELIVGQAPPPPSNSTVLVLGNSSTTRTVTVANPAEGAPLEYVITTDQPWLTANPITFGLRPGTFQAVTLSVNRNGLQPGSYSGEAVISFTGLISGFSLVTVSMDVSESAVDPVISPTLNLGPGGTSGTTIVSNPLSDSALLYTVSSHVPWLVVENSSFVLAAGASQAIIITAERGALDIGFHTGLVTISYSGAISGSSVVAVELEVPPPPPPPLIPPVVTARLDLGATGTGGIITVSTPPSGGPLKYTVTSNAPWLTASPSTFVLSPGESRPVTISVDRSGLEFGRYAAEITITFDGSTSGSSLVPVTIEMASTAFPTEGRGIETWALVLIGIGGAALLWIIVSQATIRLSGAGTGAVRPRGAPTPLSAGAQSEFGIEVPPPQPVSRAVPALQTAIGGVFRAAFQTVASGVALVVKAPLNGLGKRIDVGILAYLLSMPLLAAMVIILVLKAAGMAIGLGFIPVIIIAIGAGIVFVFTRIRRTRSGNIRRAERAAEALEEDRA